MVVVYLDESDEGYITVRVAGEAASGIPDFRLIPYRPTVAIPRNLAKFSLFLVPL